MAAQCVHNADPDLHSLYHLQEGNIQCFHGNIGSSPVQCPQFIVKQVGMSGGILQGVFNESAY